MGEPVIADNKPVIIEELEVGTYYWCACGKSKSHPDKPYCDGSHAGTEFTPVAFKIEEAKKVALCNCKKTANAPYCDGTHAKL